MLYLEELQPTQPYVDSELIHHRDKYQDENASSIEVKIIDGELVLIRGHEKAYLAMLENQKQIEVCWSQSINDTSYYKYRIEYCQKRGIKTIWDLKNHCHEKNMCDKLEADINHGYNLKRENKKTS